MICFRSPKLIIDYISNNLKQNEKITYEKHINSCSKCANAIKEQEIVKNILSDVKAQDMPSNLSKDIINKIQKIKLDSKDTFFDNITKTINKYWLFIVLGSIATISISILGYKYINKTEPDNTNDEIYIENKTTKKDLNTSKIRANTIMETDTNGLTLFFDETKGYKEKMNNLVNNGYSGETDKYYSINDKHVIKATDDMLRDAESATNNGSSTTDEVEKMLEGAVVAGHKVKTIK